jgi:hypothetical protein
MQHRQQFDIDGNIVALNSGRKPATRCRSTAVAICTLPSVPTPAGAEWCCGVELYSLTQATYFACS